MWLRGQNLNGQVLSNPASPWRVGTLAIHSCVSVSKYGLRHTVGGQQILVS